MNSIPTRPDESDTITSTECECRRCQQYAALCEEVGQLKSRAAYLEELAKKVITTLDGIVRILEAGS